MGGADSCNPGLLQVRRNAGGRVCMRGAGTACCIVLRRGRAACWPLAEPKASPPPRSGSRRSR
jgi:hypothetical protein